MQRTTKGAIAAAVAAVLLLGGSGTMSSWKSAASAQVQPINTGGLDLGALNCGTGWHYVGNGDGLVSTIVPGDTIAVTCTVSLAISGDHMKAVVTPVVPALGLNLADDPYDSGPSPINGEILSTFDLSVSSQICDADSSCAAAVSALWNHTDATSYPQGLGTLTTGDITAFDNGGTASITIKMTLPTGTANQAACVVSSPLCSTLNNGTFDTQNLTTTLLHGVTIQAAQVS